MLSVKSLTFSYENRAIFKDLNLTVQSGITLHLKGANGVGKSTLLKIIAGALQAQKGTIEFTIKGRTYSQIQGFCEYLPAENNSLYLKMDALSNLSYWFKLRGLSYSKDEIFELLDIWGLGHPLIRENFAVENFSTGMKRRLAILRLILSKTPCWLLDEPSYGLDKRGITLLQQALKDHLSKKGMAMIVSHDESIFRQVEVSHFSMNTSKSRS